MKTITKLRLAAVHQICNAQDKSSEYMLQLMQDSCKVDLDGCISYMNLEKQEHERLHKEVNELNNLLIELGNTVN
jgi:hypothetical protein